MGIMANDVFGFADPFSPGRIGGIRIVESPDVPRYTLPAEVIPGVPWPPGFREEINRWSASYLGTTNVVPRGTVYMLAGNMAVMHPRDVVMMVNAC